jgi:hypothetical protein
MAEHSELHKNDGVFGHGTKRADEPGEVCKEVLPFDGMEQDLATQSVSGKQGTFCAARRTPAPYVAFPNKDNMKNNRLSPSQDLSR